MVDEIIILDTHAFVKWSGKTRKHYEEKGYRFTGRGDIFKVKIEDISLGSEIKVNIKCPICGIESKAPIKRIYKQGHTRCNSCSQKNKISISKRDGYAIITIYSKFKSNNYDFIIDLEYLNLIKTLPLSVSSINGYNYVMTRLNGKRVALHRVIANANDNEEVDHKNHNTLDNRKSNLRIVTRSQNQMNKVKPKHNTSGYKGISYNDRDDVWRAYININKKPIFKTFNTKDEAVEWRREMENIVYKEFRYAEEDDTNE